jgi:acyl-coenzyme A thioesterase PaaI-like protein
VPDCIFQSTGEDLFLPTEHARGPWDPGALHGGAPAALIASGFERMTPGGELRFARLSFSFLRPVPMAALRLKTEIIRPGRRVQELSGELHSDGGLVCRASALRITGTPGDLPSSASETLEEHRAPRLLEPSEGRPVNFSLDTSDYASFASTAMEMRFLKGGPLIGEPQQFGPGTVWMRLRRPLIDDSPPSQLARVVACADFGNGVSAVLPFEEYVFINADLAITLQRPAQGDWIALEAQTLLYPGGICWSQSVLHDEHGPIGLATQALVVQRR